MRLKKWKLCIILETLNNKELKGKYFLIFISTSSQVYLYSLASCNARISEDIFNYNINSIDTTIVNRNFIIDFDMINSFALSIAKIEIDENTSKSSSIN